MNLKSAPHDRCDCGSRRAPATARGLTEKAGLCEHTLSLMSDPDHLALTRRRSQVVRQRSAKPLFIGSIPIAASIHLLPRLMLHPQPIGAGVEEIETVCELKGLAHRRAYGKLRPSIRWST